VTGQQKKKRSTVLATAQSNRDPVLRPDHRVVFDTLNNAFLNIMDKMGAAQVTMGMLLVYHGRLGAAGAWRGTVRAVFFTHISPPMGDPDNPDLVIGPHYGILWYEGSVA
jgi:hypothetical protein